MSVDLTRKMLAAAAWERAKGALREVVRIQGHIRLTQPSRTLAEDQAASSVWEDLNARVEQFIDAVEMDGLQE